MLVENTCCPVPALDAEQRSHPTKPKAPYYAGACGQQMHQKGHDGHTLSYQACCEDCTSVMVSITVCPDL